MIGVIGGSGFIGTVLVRALRESGHSVRIIDKARSVAFPDLHVEADVRDQEGLAAACAGCSALYNLAAEHADDVQPHSLYHEVNVTGAKHVCAVAEHHGIERLVFTSSVAVYGLVEEEVDERGPVRPFNDYSRTKLEAEQVFRDCASRQPNRSLTIVRSTVVFGPGNRGNVYNLLAQVARGRNLVVGDGTNRKSMASVENVADFLAFVLRFGPGVHLYNYVDKPDLDMNELVSLASQTLGGDAKPRHVPYGLALGTGLAFDLAARLMGRRFPISAVRVRKYGATSRFAAQHLAESGFVPRHDLRRSLIAWIEHEFCPARETTKTDERIA
jgi:nucleoside-diphosphate-sugar epimerase